MSEGTHNPTPTTVETSDATILQANSLPDVNPTVRPRPRFKRGVIAYVLTQLAWIIVLSLLIETGWIPQKPDWMGPIQWAVTAAFISLSVPLFVARYCSQPLTVAQQMQIDARRSDKERRKRERAALASSRDENRLRIDSEVANEQEGVTAKEPTEKLKDTRAPIAECVALVGLAYFFFGPVVAVNVAITLAILAAIVIMFGKKE